MRATAILIYFSFFFGFCQTIEITPFATGFNFSLEVTHAGDSRLFVVEKGGKIRILNSDGTINAIPFLTIPDEILDNSSDRGLLGLAFHPAYQDNGYFYVFFSKPGNELEISRFSVTSDPDVADPSSRFVILTIPHPFFNHYGGTMKFGPDHYLYIGTGDGGDGGWRSQDIDDNLGKILRIDVDAGFPFIPIGNPLVGILGNDEIWATGLRNPWKFSFDRQTGELWIADVGEVAVEEINRVPASLVGGLNFGWPCFEGDILHVNENCPLVSLMTFPFASYAHPTGCSIIGGYVYRGTLYPYFSGKYFFADFCVNRLGALDTLGNFEYSDTWPGSNYFTTLGEDVSGELYVASGTTIFKISDAGLGLSQLSENGLSLYPNPAAGQVSLYNNSQKTITKLKLYNLTGELLLEQNLQPVQNNIIDIGRLKTGLYVATIEDISGARFTSKLIIQ